MMAFVAMAASAAPGKSAGEILRDIEHLQVVGSVLYVAAHPDDENTRLIGYLVGQRGYRTAYLSMTRGDGGQNLIGAEQDALLGVLRTGELLAARGVDGGEQRFTRMRDFGYSKSSEETLRLWGHDEALDDVVRAIREFRPDVIVTRFPTTGDTHGHHLASAILAGEAFTKAADPSYVTEGLSPWAADRLLFNRTRWTMDPATDTSAWATLDTGVYDPRIGRSYGEQAAISRSMHKSQGFGDAPQVGPIPEYFETVAGAQITPGQDPFAGMPLDWSRFDGTKPLQRALEAAAERFDPRAPWSVLPQLAKARALLEVVPDDGWRAVKRAELDRVMADCVGLWLTARAEAPSVAPGGSLKVTLTAVARAPVPVWLVSASVHGQPVDGATLAENAPWTADVAVVIPPDMPPSQPHWLVERGEPTRYRVSDASLRNRAEAGPSLTAEFVVEVGGVALTFRRPVEHAWTDPVQGERLAAAEVLPPVTATFSAPSRVLPEGGGASRITLRATSGPASGVLRLKAPPGVRAAPSEVPFTLAAGAELVVDVALAAEPGAPAGDLVAELEGRPGFQQYILDYPHVPKRTILSPAAQKLVPMKLARGATKAIGYVRGPGDPVPEALRSVGYEVEEIDEDRIASGDLKRFDAILMGVRAYNTRPRLLALHDALMAYVAGGGRLVVQYNTNNRFDPLVGSIGPYPFEIGRGRVTDEAADVGIVDAKHPFWTGPNTLGPADFEGWVQERGLYFATTWDPQYTPLMSMHDPGEDALLGSTLVARHGEGVFVYTGLSLWRQLPAGVPGAYRVLANLLALR